MNWCPELGTVLANEEVIDGKSEVGGFPVVLKDINQELVDAGIEEARNVTAGQVARLVKKEKLTQEQADAQVEEVVGRITGTTSYEGFGDVDFVIEAVPEKMESKRSVFAELDAATPGHAILACQPTVDDRRDHDPFPVQARCPAASAVSITDCARRSCGVVGQPVAHARGSRCEAGHLAASAPDCCRSSRARVRSLGRAAGA